MSLQERPSSTKMAEVRETQRLLQSESLSSAWAYKINMADEMLGGGKDFLGIGAEIASTKPDRVKT